MTAGKKAADLAQKEAKRAAAPQPQMGRQIPIEEIMAELGEKDIEIRFLKKEAKAALTLIQSLTIEKEGLEEKVKKLTEQIAKLKKKK